MNNLSLVIETKQQLKCINKPIDDHLLPDEVLIKVHYVALCGSDIKLYKGQYTAPHRYPIILGHEWIGEVVATGTSAESKWCEKDIVTGDCSIYCGSCEQCKKNKNLCERVQKRGITIDGAGSQYVKVSSKYLYKCPKTAVTLPYVLTEPLAVAVEGIKKIGSQKLSEAKEVLILGAGGIGALSAIALIDQGVSNITISDVEEVNIRTIQSMGLTNATPIHADMTKNVSEYVNHFDLIIEASGNENAIVSSLHLLRPGGTLLCLGHQNSIHIDFGMVIKKSLNIIGSIGGTGGFQEAIRIIERNEKCITKLITRMVPIDSVQHFFSKELDLQKNVKIVIEMN
ncbi:alcohol dehydrogenase catalytic domain-containing protein [Paenibacillus sp. FSL L8-0340]|uniref:zinc-dependent alcohol dehydrogenase n=1 Tax=Paenibacillus sp. FSL L8-0340 TaxID=2954685 RepID=UPI003158B2B7